MRINNIAGLLYYVFLPQCMDLLFVLPYQVIDFSELVDGNIACIARELNSHTYKPFELYISIMITDIIELFFWSLSIILGFYFIIGLDHDSDKFFNLFLLIILATNIMYAYGIIFAIFFTMELSLILINIVFVPFLVLGGYFINLTSIPVGVLFLSYLSPFRYLFQASLKVC